MPARHPFQRSNAGTTIDQPRTDQPGRGRRPGGRRLLAIAAVAVLAAIPVLAACGSSSGSSASATTADGTPDLSKVTLRVADQVRGTESRVEASGVLKGAPYKVEWSQFAAAAPQLQALRAGAADVASAGDAPTLNALGAGAEIKVVGAVRAEDLSGLALLVPKDSPIKTLADLRGKRISPTTKGSIGHYLLLGALAKAGLTTKDVKISFLTPSAASAAFSSGQLDAWSVWDPYTALAESKGARPLITSQGISQGLGLVDASTKALADPAKRAAIADFVRRFGRSFDWASAHPTDFAKLYSSLTKLPLDAATTVANRSHYRLVPIDDMVVSSLQEEAGVYFTAGVIPKRLDVSSALVTSLN
jgi:sulfonate transport system substrate-binding protein